MNLLELVQAFTKRTALASPSAVVSSADDQIRQIAGLLDEVLEYVADRHYDWSPVVLEATFTTLAAEDQGAITALAPSGYKHILNNTIFDRTRQLPFYGPLSAGKWQQDKVFFTTGPFYKYRIVRGRLLLNPAPPAGHSCAFEYASSHAVLASDGLTSKAYPTADDDTFLLPPTVLLAGLRWKWKYEKGLEYAEDFRTFEELLSNAIGRDGSKPALSMDGESGSATPGIFVSPGSWSLP